MALRDSIWYGLGRGTERLASALSRADVTHEDSSSASGAEEDGPGGAPERGATDLILVAGLSAAALSGLRRWADGRRPAIGSLVRGALAGAGAAACVHVVRVLGRPRSETVESEPSDALDRLLAGAGRGLIYSAILDPLLPGPPIVRGALAGTAEYLAAPLGGLFTHLETLSPIRRVPFISVLLETGKADENDRFLSFLAYGVILSAIYGASEGTRGT